MIKRHQAMGPLELIENLNIWKLLTLGSNISFPSTFCSGKGFASSALRLSIGRKVFDSAIDFAVFYLLENDRRELWRHQLLPRYISCKLLVKR